MQRGWRGATAAVLAAAGFGLLLWLGISVALVSHGAAMATLRALQVWSLIVAFALLALAGGLVIADAGGLPAARRRAPTRWHTRRNALALAAIVAGCAVGALLAWPAPGGTRALLLGLGGMLLSIASLGAVGADAMAHSDAAAAGGRHPLLVPLQLLSAMLTGLALMFALMAGLLAIGHDGGRMLAILMVLCTLTAAAQLLYRHDTARSTGARATAAPASGADRRDRFAAPLLLVAVPALALALGAGGVVGVRPLLWLVAGATLLGALLARRALPAPAAFEAAS